MLCPDTCSMHDIALWFGSAHSIQMMLCIASLTTEDCYTLPEQNYLVLKLQFTQNHLTYLHLCCTWGHICHFANIYFLKTVKELTWRKENLVC